MSWIKEFKENALFRIDENVRMISIALSKVGEDETWVKQNENVIPLGNQLLHIMGNIKQYVISGLGGKEDTRNRESEFDTTEGPTKDDLLKDLLLLIQDVTKTIENASEEDFLKEYKVQGFNLSGIGIVLHAVEHFSYHTGQIATIIKFIVDEPLGFYAGLDLNILNDTIDDGALDEEKTIEEEAGTDNEIK